MTTVLTVASCVSESWLQYAVLVGLDSGGTNDALSLGLVFPLAGVIVFLVVDRLEVRAPPTPPLPVAVKPCKKHKKHSSFRV